MQYVAERNGTVRVIHPGELQYLEGGIKTAIQQQREMMDRQGITYTKSFSRDADILHVNVFSPRDLWFMARAKRHGIPVIAHGHETGENFRESFRFSNQLSPLVKAYLTRIYRTVDHVITPTPHAKRVLKSRIDTPISVMSNGIQPDDLQGTQDMETQWDRDEVTVVNLSLLFERKGLSDFVTVAEQMDDTPFIWFGSSLNRLLRPSNVDRVIEHAPANMEFPGFVEDKREAFATADIFFFPTKSETQGISLLEAAYCGLPIVTRDIPVFEDWLVDGEHCLKGSSVNEFREHIERLKKDDALRRELGENARDLAEKHTVKAVSDELRDIYVSVTGIA